MITTLFFAFLIIGIILTIFGFVSDLPLFSFVGCIMMFLLGLNLLAVGLDYKVGENSTIIVDGDNVSNSVTVDVYANYDDSSTNRFGWFFLALGALGFSLALFEL